MNAVLPKIALGEDYQLPPAVINLDATTLSRYTGSYSASSGSTFQIRAKDGYLYVSENNLSLPSSVLFLPQSHSEFTGFDPADSKIISLRFEMTADGSVANLVRRFDSREFESQQVEISPNSNGYGLFRRKRRRESLCRPRDYGARACWDAAKCN